MSMPPKLFDRLHEEFRHRYCSNAIAASLTHVAVNKWVAASTQN